MKPTNLFLVLFIALAIGAWFAFYSTPETAVETPVQISPVTAADMPSAARDLLGQSAMPVTAESAPSKRQHGLPLPTEAGQVPSPALPPGLKPAPGALLPMPTPEPGYVPVMVLDCGGMFANDQQSQRNCEAGEKKRLLAGCAAAKTRQAEATTDGARKTQEILVRSVCREAERYAGPG